MEMQSILPFLENKSILLIGATGFVAKGTLSLSLSQHTHQPFHSGVRAVLIEKILRVQPNVKKLYLLLRAADSSSASHRFNTEVMGKELFKVVREKYGAKLNWVVLEKVSVVCGDISREWMGLDSSTLEKLFAQVNIIINLAATTNFDERYDIALGINTTGPANILKFAKKCSKLRVFLHVSTAYVHGEKEGVIMEAPLKLGNSLNGRDGLDIEREKKIIEDELKQQHIERASEDDITLVMKNLGVLRSKKYGWPNTYSFTKAMGEMVLGHDNVNTTIPLVIIRPTIITSTFKEPFPGWLEGLRNIDSFVVGYGKGKMACFPGDPETIVDLIPADMVVNAMIASMAANADYPTQTIYHVGSSTSNPVAYRQLQDYGFRYFTEQPWIGKNGKPIIVRKGIQLATKDAVRKYMQLHYFIPLKILGFVNTASCNYFQQTYLDLARKVVFFMRLIQLFTPYVFFKGVFDDMNTEKLRREIKENEMFNFDPKTINWDDYFVYAHIAGVVKYSFTR